MASSSDSNSTLEQMITKNKFKTSFSDQLRRLARNDSTLTTLNLWDNEIGPTGAASIAQALSSNSTLTTLLLLNSKHLCNFKYIAGTYIIKVYNRFSRSTIFPCVRKLTHPYQTNIDIEKFGYKLPVIQKI